MEALTTIISIALLIGLISTPILLFYGVKKWSQSKFNFLTYIILGIIITAGITLIFAWWADYSDQLLMSHYGYDFDAMNDTERFGKVQDANLEKVKQLEIGYFGIGWPLKAIMSYVFYSPYLLIVYLVGQSIKRMKLKKSNKNALQQQV
jgi:hypothetical protein